MASELNNGFLKLIENLGVGSNFITLQAPTLTDNVILTLPDNEGTVGYLMTTDGNGALSWLAPSGSTSTSILLEDPGAASTIITLHAKVGTAAFALSFPGTVGTTGQVLSTGSAPGTMEWVNKISPGGPIDGTLLNLKNPSETAVVTFKSKAATAAFTLTLPGTTGLANQVLSTGATPGTLEWVDNHLPPGGAITQLQYYKTGGVFGGSTSLTWDELTLSVIGKTLTHSLSLKNSGAVAVVNISPKVGTGSYNLALPGTIGLANQVLSTGATPGIMEWVDKVSPGGPIDGTLINLKNPTETATVTLKPKAATAAFTLTLPGTTGLANQVLSTGGTPGTLEWVDNHLPPGGAITQLQYYKTGGVFGGSTSLTWDELTLSVIGKTLTHSLSLKNSGAVAVVNISPKVGTGSYNLALPGTIGLANQVLSTGATPGIMEWVDKVSPGGPIDGTLINLKNPTETATVTLKPKAATAAFTLTLPGTTGLANQVLSTGGTPGILEWVDKVSPGGALDGTLINLKNPTETATVTLKSKAATAAFTLTLPGTTGLANQVLSTGGTPGTLEWVYKVSPGGALDGTLINLKNPTETATVTLKSKAATAAFTLTLPGTTGLANQVLSTGGTPGTLEWVDNHLPPGGAITQLQYYKTGGVFGGSTSLTWDEVTLSVIGKTLTHSLSLKNSGAVAVVNISPKVGTGSYNLALPGTIGLANQVLSTGATPGIMEWVDKVSPGGALDGTLINLKNPTETATVTLKPKAATFAFTLTLPGTTGLANQVLSTGATPGTLEWVDNHLPPGGAITQLQYYKTGGVFGGSTSLTWDEVTLSVIGKTLTHSLSLKNSGAVAVVNISPKVGTGSYNLALPGTIGLANQVLSTGATPGIMEWVDKVSPGGALDGTLINLKNPTETATVTLKPKAATAAFTLTLPGTTGLGNQVLSTGATPGTLEWVNRIAPGGPLNGTSLVLEDPGAATTAVTINAKVGTSAFILTLPVNQGLANQVLTTGATAGVMEWVDKISPGGAIPGSSLVLTNPGDASVSFKSKGGTSAFTLTLPGTTGLAGQVLSTGATPGTMEWVYRTIPGGSLDGTSLVLEDPGAATTAVTINAKVGTSAFILTLPVNQGLANQVLTTGATAGVMEWVDKISPGGAIPGSSLVLTNPGDASVSFKSKGGTAAFTLTLPGTTGLAGQVLSTGSTPGTMEWVYRTIPGGSIDGTSLVLEDPGAAATTVTINAKVGTAAFILTLPVNQGLANQVLTTGATAGVMEWVDKISPGGAIPGSSLVLTNPGDASVSFKSKGGTAAFTLTLPGTTGLAGQVLSTGSTPGTMEWVYRTIPGGSIDGTSLVLEDPGAAATKVTINAKVGTAAYILTLPLNQGLAGQVLSTGSTAGVMEWVYKITSGGPILGSSLVLKNETDPYSVTIKSKAATAAFSLTLPGSIGTSNQVLSTGATPGTMEWVSRSPLDRTIIQSCFVNPTGSGTVTSYSSWGAVGGGPMDYTMIGISGTIVKLSCSYSGLSSIGIDAGESIKFSIGYTNLIQTVFTVFAGGLDVISWTTTNNATHPSTSSSSLNIPFTAVNRIAIRSLETGTITPITDMKINCSLTVQLNEV